MQEDKKETLPIDARLLLEAVTELNISRRSIGLYPPDHPAVTEAVERAFDYLQKLLELRNNITLGIAKDTIIYGGYALERKNPAFSEFAHVLHIFGIAAITFSSGLTREELVRFHELITSKNPAFGAAFVELVTKQDIRHIVLNPIDFSAFGFVEGAKSKSGRGSEIWEDYVYSLIEGKLAEDDLVLGIPPKEMARLVDAVMSEERGEEAYNRVIKAYLKRGDSRISRDLLISFILFLDALNPMLKEKFLFRAFSHASVNIKEIERALYELTIEDLQVIAEFFTEHSSIIPDTLKGLVDKLNRTRKGNDFNFDIVMHGTAIVDDIEVSRDIAGFLKGDNLSSYVSEGYRRDLARMMASSQAGSADTGGLKAEFKDEALDKATSGVFLELLWSDLITEEDSSGLLARLTELMDIFVDTGRFEDILYIYDAVFSMEYPGKFKDAAISMMENFLSSRQFISRLAGAFILRGKNNMESVVRLANALRLYIVKPLLEILSEETNTGNRKFLLSVLGELGRDILPHAVNKLNDNRWYVIRNMLYLIRQCDGRKYLDHARRFIGHKNTKISMEALKTLLHFHTPDAVSCLKSYLQAEDTAMRTQAINIAGLYRVKDAVSYLLKLLEKKDVRGRDLPLKIQTVKALGRIGDPSVVKSLEKICSSKTLLYKDSLEELKLEIFRTLNGYPRASVMPLIDAGLSSKNEKIRALSMKLLKQTA